jgi:PIN domain nuclease of toxin-antitoxin system
MSFLLDTHILLWWLEDDPTLSAEAKTTIQNPDNFIFVSAASVWEMSIKKSLGKLKIPNNLLEVIEENEFQVLAVTAEHGLKVGELPYHHKDPFDRILIAQALHEGFTIISRDGKFKLYDAPLLEG